LVPHQQLKLLQPLKKSSTLPDTPPPRIPLIRVSSEPTTFPVYLKEAGGDGNCFLNSIYDAANEQNLLEKIYNKYKTETKPVDKTAFVTYIRGLVANQIIQDDEGLRTVYEIFEQSDIKNKLNLEEPDIQYLVKDFQPWLIDLYKNSKNFEEFKTNVTNTIRTSNNYTQGLEYSITQDLLEPADIEIESHMVDNAESEYTGITELNKLNDDNIPVIHLLNQTYSLGHFKYFSFIKPLAAVAAVKVAPALAPVAPTKPSSPQVASKVEEKKPWYSKFNFFGGRKQTKRNHNKSIKNKKSKKTKRRM
jgi:hypothetical protein